MTHTPAIEEVPGLIAVAENMPPISAPSDAEVDLEILRAIPKQFEINDEKTANWLVRKVLSARKYASDVADWAESEKRRAEREEHCLLFLFGRQLETWAKEELQRRGGKRKSIGLPGGTLCFRTLNPSLQVDDEQMVLAWAKSSLPSAVVISEKLSRAILGDHFRSTGEVPPAGAHVDKGGERFSIR